MALHTELRIYKAAYGLLRLSIDAKSNMRRDFKNSLGTRIHDECIEILVLIADVNASEVGERPPLLKAMLRHVGKVEFLLRVCNDMNLISPKIWADAIELLQNVGAQGGGWLRSYVKAPVV
jgi:hypothetical protein